MARNISAKLTWEGPYTDPASITGKAGIYMVIAGREKSSTEWDTSTYKLLDIGQTGQGAERLADHERERCWQLNKPAGTTILFKFAAMPSEQYDETDRRIVECCLRAHHRPLSCGIECNEGYNRDDSVKIENVGKHAPLHPSYSCGKS